jgi:hypothetical protein
MNRVLSLIGTLGDPKPEQAAKLLNQYTASVTTMIPYRCALSPPPARRAMAPWAQPRMYTRSPK